MNFRCIGEYASRETAMKSASLLMYQVVPISFNIDQTRESLLVWIGREMKEPDKRVIISVCETFKIKVDDNEK